MNDWEQIFRSVLNPELMVTRELTTHSPVTGLEYKNLRTSGMRMNPVTGAPESFDSIIVHTGTDGLTLVDLTDFGFCGIGGEPCSVKASLCCPWCNRRMCTFHRVRMEVKGEVVWACPACAVEHDPHKTLKDVVHFFFGDK